MVGIVKPKVSIDFLVCRVFGWSVEVDMVVRADVVL